MNIHVVNMALRPCVPIMHVFCHFIQRNNNKEETPIDDIACSCSKLSVNVQCNVEFFLF